MMLNSIFLLSLALISATGIVLWWRFIQLPRPQREGYLAITHSSPIGMLDFVVAFAIWLGAPSVAFSLLPFEISNIDKLTGEQRNIVYAAVASGQLVGCGLLILYLWFRYRSVSWLLNLKPSLSAQCMLAGKAFCMVVPFVLGIQALLSLLVPYEHDTLSQLSDNFSLQTILATWYGAVLAAPLCEELVFRGVLQSWLHRIYLRRNELDALTELTGGWSETEEKAVTPVKPKPVSLFRWWSPILITSAAFAVIHIGQGAAPIPLFLFAIGLGFLYQYCGSLIPCIILHFMLNAFTMFWTTLQLVFDNV